MTENTALTRIEPQSTEVSFPVDLVEHAEKFALNSRSKGTQKHYAKLYSYYVDWCVAHTRDPMPIDGVVLEGQKVVDTPEYKDFLQTLVLYVTHLATKGGKRGKPMAITSIGATMAAIRAARALRRYSLEMFNDERLVQVRKGVNREIASTRTVRRVNPITDDQMSDLLDTLQSDSPHDARDAAILAIGFGCALRRSEIVSLDWAAMGEYEDDDPSKARGFVTIDDKGVYARLLVSKTNQEGGDELCVLSREAAPRLCQAVENWVTLAKIKKGTPLFRVIRVAGRGKKGSQSSGYIGVRRDKAQQNWRADHEGAYVGHYKTAKEAHLAICAKTGKKPVEPYTEGFVTDKRSTALSVAKMVKARLMEWRRTQPGGRKMKAEELAEWVKDFSGHSMRSGHVTAAAERGIPTHHIQATSRHKDAKMISVYTRVTDKHKNSSLKGSGL